MKIIIKFFDKLEDKIRGRLSHFPIFYAFLGGVGMVIFWRGIWHTADFLMESFFSIQVQESTMSMGDLPWWDGPLSILIGSSMLLATGLFVSGFIGNEIIISGLRGEKKIAEKTEAEVKTETGTIGDIKSKILEISSRLEKIEKNLK